MTLEEENGDTRLIELKVYEQSRFATETGAAIHIAPNANGLLKRLGVEADQIGANLMERVCN